MCSLYSNFVIGSQCFSITQQKLPCLLAVLSRFNRAELRIHYAFSAAMPTRVIALQRKLQVAYVGRTPAVGSYSVMLKC